MLPTVNPTLSDYIIKLTGIKQEQINLNGISFASSLVDLYSFSDDGKLPVFCWGGRDADEAVLRENCDLNKLDFSKFFNHFYDIRDVFESSGIDISC